MTGQSQSIRIDIDINEKSVAKVTNKLKDSKELLDILGEKIEK